MIIEDVLIGAFQQILFHYIKNIDIHNMEIILKYFPGLTNHQIEQFKALDNLYSEWNSKINVISRKDISSLYEKHILHSLSIAGVFDFKAATDILDIGTGGGFPGIPLAIFFPEVNFHLIDSINKKLNVVRGIAESIELKNICTTHIRAEEIKNRRYDFVVTRAVAPLKNLWNWSKPLLKNPVSKSSKDNQRSNARGNFESSQPDKTPAGILGIKTPGLIALKGGNLEKELLESGLKPKVIEITGIFSEEFFKEKYILYVSNKNTA